MKNVLSVDLESWAENRKQDAGFIAESVDKLLALFGRHGFKTTFFVVGEVYDWYPEAIEKIAAAGHEIGWHTHSHQIIRGPEHLSRELELSRAFLDRFQPQVFRAPTMRITRDCFPLLYERGFRIKSSIYAPWSLAGSYGGMFEAPVSSYVWRGEPPWELTFPRPMTPGLLKSEIPFGSSFFMGVLGKGVSWFVRKVTARGEPAIMFVHPWQIYNCPPAPNLDPHPLADLLVLPYRRKIPRVVDYLLENFEFASLGEVVKLT